MVFWTLVVVSALAPWCCRALWSFVIPPRMDDHSSMTMSMRVFTAMVDRETAAAGAATARDAPAVAGARMVAHRAMEPAMLATRGSHISLSIFSTL